MAWQSEFNMDMLSYYDLAGKKVFSLSLGIFVLDGEEKNTREQLACIQVRRDLMMVDKYN